MKRTHCRHSDIGQRHTHPAEPRPLHQCTLAPWLRFPRHPCPPLKSQCVLVAQLCPTLCDPMDYSLPSSFVHVWAKPWTNPCSPHVRNQLNSLSKRARGAVCSCLPLLQQGPHKALPELLVWPLLVGEGQAPWYHSHIPLAKATGQLPEVNCRDGADEV